MSNSEVLTPILLRSSTPAPSEKGSSLHQPVPRPPSDHRAPVLLYLEGIQRSGGASPVRDSMMTESMQTDLDPNDPRFHRLTQATSQHRSSGLSKQAYNANDGDLHDLGNSELSYDMIENAEVASNVQDGLRSEFAGSERGVPVYDDGHEEPGPEDEPGPKYVSGSSFGNLGPPRESIFGPPTQQTQQIQPTWIPRGTTPSRAANVPLPPDSEMMSPRSRHRAPWGQAVLRPTNEASAMTPRTAEIDIDVEPPTDPSRQSTNHYSRAPSRHSRRSSGGRQDVVSPPPQASSQQLPGITVSINPDGSTIISIPRASPAEKTPTERAPTEKAPTEKALSEVPDELRSPRARSQKPVGSVAGSYRRPSGGEADPLFSPGAQSRALKSPKAMSKAPSRTASRVPSQMSPVDSHMPLNGYQSFAMPPESSYGEQGPDSHRAQSTRAPSQRPAASNREPSELGTVPNEFTSDAGYSRSLRDGRVPGAFEYNHGRHPSDHTNGYMSNPLRPGSVQHGPMPALPLPPQMQQSRPSTDNMDSRNIRPKMQTLSPVPSAPNTLRTEGEDSLVTPTQTQTRPLSPEEDLNDYETEIVQGILSARTPRTSIAPSLLAEEIKRSNYHDEALCILLHAADDPTQHEIVRKALRKAVAARIRKLGYKSDKESIRQYRKKYHDHDPSWHSNHIPSYNPDDPPAWAKEMMEQLQSMENRVVALGPQLAQLKKSDGSRTRTHSHTYHTRGAPTTETADEWDQTPRTQTIPIGTQMTGADSAYRPPQSEYTTPEGESVGPTTMRNSALRPTATEQDEFEDEETQDPTGPGRAYTNRTPTQDGDYISSYAAKRGDLLSSTGRGESPGQQVLEEGIYRLRAKGPARSGVMTHQNWELREDSVDDHPETQAEETEIPDIDEEPPRAESPPLPPLPTQSHTAVTPAANGGQVTSANNERQWEYHEAPPTPPWQRIHQRLLNWAIVWPMSELDNALASTKRGNQVDEVALSIWCTQMYKRYVRQQLTEVPPGRVDRLFVPPNMADAINNAVFHGRHGDACGMLRDLWTPFGLEGMPRIILVLCKHRSDPNHWVAHKFSLPDGTLTTYDTYPEKSLPDGRPLGWWFSIRIAWPSAMYPSPDNLMQKMVRLHRPMQLSIDNSVAAAGIWRNLLMGSRAERPVDLERLRDLINTEVKNLRQRKEQGKLSVAAQVRQNWNWDDMAT
ncbi:hypothetical protein ACEPAG_8026 [Sanghuangporus baumii]